MHHAPGETAMLIFCVARVLYGRLELTAPMEEGKYEITAWAVNNPYGEIEKGMQDLHGAPRITLSAEK